MGKTLVSVVVPLYNKKKTVLRALTSIIGQKYTNLEVIVVDDGSTDGGGEVVANVGDPRIRLHRQENLGPGAARNFGTLVSSGSLITYLDADDEWCESLIATAVARLAEHRNCDVFTSNFRLGEAGGSRWARLTEAPRVEGPSRLDASWAKDEIVSCLVDFHSCSAVYRRDVVLAHGGFFEEDHCTFGEDVYLWIKIRLHHAIYRHAETLAYYHMEDSELGVGGRKSALPLEPVFTHTNTVRQSCPAELKGTFDIWLGKHALRAGFLHLRDGRADLLDYLMHNIPEMQLWPTEYWHLRAKRTVPALWMLKDRCQKFVGTAFGSGAGALK